MGEDCRTNGGGLSYKWGRDCRTSGGGAKHCTPEAHAPLSYKWGRIITQIRDGIAKLYQLLDATGPCLWHRPVAPHCRTSGGGAKHCTPEVHAPLSYKWGMIITQIRDALLPKWGMV